MPALLLRFLAVLALGQGVVLAADAEPPTRLERPQPVQVDRVDHVIGSGSPQSIRMEDLRRAFKEGGNITFDTGGQPVTIPINEQLVMSQHAEPIVMDGLGLVTFDGLERSRIIEKEWKTDLTIQRCTFVNARAEREGGAILTAWDGNLGVIDCDFRNCKTTSDGPDIGGGAIRSTGQKTLTIAGCTFVDCAGSNGGAVCDIGSSKTFIDCTFRNCLAFGRGGGADQGPTGKGGIGGAVYGDGVDQAGGTPRWYFEDCLFAHNRAYDHAGGIFAYTRPNQPNVTIFLGCMFVDNAVERPDGSEPNIKHGGAVYNQHTALHVHHCTFVGNRTPGIGPMLFTAKMRSISVVGCDGEDNVGRGRAEADSQVGPLGTPAAAVRFIGGKPGHPLPEEKADDDEDERERRRAERAAEREARLAERPEHRIPEEVHAAWRTRLVARLQARLERGADMRFASEMMGGKDAVVEAVTADRLTLKTRKLALPIGWDRVAEADRLALAKLVAEDSEEPGDHAVASWYHFLHGDRFQAKEHLMRAGELKDRIDADLGR